MRQITLTLSVRSISYQCTTCSSCYQLTQYFRRLHGFVECEVSHVRVLSVCLLFYYFVSAAGCHCFDLDFRNFSHSRWLSSNRGEGVPLSRFPSSKTLTSSKILSENNTQISVTIEICITIDFAPLKKIPGRKPAHLNNSRR